MFGALYVDGDPAAPSDDIPQTVSLEFDTDYPRYRCRACGEELIETADGYETESGENRCLGCEPWTDSDEGDRPHDAQCIPLSWCNSAAVHTDESQDSITVSISVGDPRGAFTFTLRRVPDDTESDLAGQLIMHTPYAGQPCGHMQLTTLHDGTYLVGPHPSPRRLQRVPAA